MRTLRGFAHIVILLAIQTSTPWMSQKAVSAEVEIQKEQKTAPTIQELEQGIADRLKRVEEFKFIEEEAKKLGVRAYLFGGTAAGYAHYVKWDMQREKGDPRFQKDRFDYDYTNIYRSTQDLDIVIDGNPEQANKLQQALQQKYPHLQGNKTAWEVRLLTQDMGDKQAILNNPDFMNQHTDSNSTGMIEITKPKNGEHVVRDVRDWNSKEPYFLKDVHDGMLHYYFSPLHNTTKFAKEGRNPPILSAIRFLTKAFQYELEIRPEDLASIKKIIRDFDPNETAKNDYVAKWIEKNGKKLIQNAVNIEYAKNTLDQLGLREKLQSIRGDISTADSLAWWVNKEPLRTVPIGQGSGKTAKELGLDIVAHETNNFLAYESITRAHTGDPNVLISRQNSPGEAAIYGDGFYTKTGKEGAAGTGLTIRFHLDPNAREGHDFAVVPEHHYVVVKNKAALKVIPESLNIGPVEYFELLSRTVADFQKSDLGIFEKLKRRIGAKTFRLSPTEIDQILKMVKDYLRNSPEPKYAPLLSAWFSLPIAHQYPEIMYEALDIDTLLPEIARNHLKQAEWKKPEIIEKLISKVNPEKSRHQIPTSHIIAIDILSQPNWKDHPELVEMLLEKGNLDSRIATTILSQPHWKNHPEWVERLMRKGNVDNEIMTSVLSKPHWADHPEWVEKYLENEKFDKPIASYVLSQPQWKDHPEWVEKLLSRGNADREIAQWILSSPDWKNYPHFVEQLLAKGNVDDQIAQSILSKPHWANHSEWLEKLLERGKTDTLLAAYVFSKDHWAHRADLLEKLIERGKADAEIINYVLTYPFWKDHPELVAKIIDKPAGPLDGEIAKRVLSALHWKDHPELVIQLLKKGNASGSIAHWVLGQPHWRSNPELRRLAGGQDPTIQNLSAALIRGETLQVSPQKNCVIQALDQNLR